MLGRTLRGATAVGWTPQLNRRRCHREGPPRFACAEDPQLPAPFPSGSRPSIARRAHRVVPI